MLGRGRADGLEIPFVVSLPLAKFSQSKKGRFVKVGRKDPSMLSVAVCNGGCVRFILRGGGDSFAARSRLRRRRLGDGTGVANANGGSARVGGLKRTVAGMVITTNNGDNTGGRYCLN